MDQPNRSRDPGRQKFRKGRPTKTEGKTRPVDKRRNAIVANARIAAAAFLVALLGFGALNIGWRYERSLPAVTLLGGGDQLSVLVTSGEARVLIANGGDPEELALALGEVQRPTVRRIDLLLTASAADAASIKPATRAAIRLPLQVVPERASPFVAGAEPSVLPTPSEIMLNDDLSLLLETRRAPGSGADEWFWRATVRRGQETVVLLSDGAAARLFAPVSRATVLVVLAGAPLDAWSANRASGVLFPDSALSPAEVRSLPADKPRPGFLGRVFPGETVKLEFLDAGIRLPAETRTATVGTPTAGYD